MPNNDYILRSDALNTIHSVPPGNWSRARYMDAVERVPAADVEPKRETGRWSVIEGKIRRDIDKRIVKCTLCGNYLSMEGVNCGRGDANYCPHCGAKMDAADHA